MGSSRTRARARVPCIGRRILNHCATREALLFSHSLGGILLGLGVCSSPLSPGLPCDLLLLLVPSSGSPFRLAGGLNFVTRSAARRLSQVLVPPPCPPLRVLLQPRCSPLCKGACSSAPGPSRPETRLPPRLCLVNFWSFLRAWFRLGIFLRSSRFGQVSQ